MGGQPEIGIQNGAHHFHGVAVQCQVLGNDQSDKPHPCRDHRPNTIFMKFFEDEPENYRSPTDKNRGGIEIGNRGTTLQDNTINEAGGVDQ